MFFAGSPFGLDPKTTGHRSPSRSYWKLGQCCSLRVAGRAWACACAVQRAFRRPAFLCSSDGALVLLILFPQRAIGFVGGSVPATNVMGVVPLLLRCLLNVLLHLPRREQLPVEMLVKIEECTPSRSQHSHSPFPQQQVQQQYACAPCSAVGCDAYHRICSWRLVRGVNCYCL